MWIGSKLVNPCTCLAWHRLTYYRLRSSFQNWGHGSMPRPKRTRMNHWHCQNDSTPRIGTRSGNWALSGAGPCPQCWSGTRVFNVQHSTFNPGRIINGLSHSTCIMIINHRGKVRRRCGRTVADRADHRPASRNPWRPFTCLQLIFRLH